MTIMIIGIFLKWALGTLLLKIEQSFCFSGQLSKRVSGSWRRTWRSSWWWTGHCWLFAPGQHWAANLVWSALLALWTFEMMIVGESALNLIRWKSLRQLVKQVGQVAFYQTLDKRYLSLIDIIWSSSAWPGIIGLTKNCLPTLFASQHKTTKPLVNGHITHCSAKIRRSRSMERAPHKRWPAVPAESRTARQKQQFRRPSSRPWSTPPTRSPASPSSSPLSSSERLVWPDQCRCHRARPLRKSWLGARRRRAEERRGERVSSSLLTSQPWSSPRF